jgi:hypothetical protein
MRELTRKKMRAVVTSLIGMAVLAFMAAAVTVEGAEEWAVKGDYAESCNCKPTCPCYFGSPPTHSHCDAAMWIEIKEGHYGDVRLEGISSIAVFRLGKWVEFYVSDNANDDQVKAAQKLLETVFAENFPPAGTGVLSTEKAPISVERTESSLKFSVPTTTVEIEMMKGLEGKPIKIQNLPLDWTKELLQYKSITLSHNSKNKKFSYSGTNGFVAKLEASSKK